MTIAWMESEEMGRRRVAVEEGQGFLFDSTHFYTEGEEPWLGKAITDLGELDCFLVELACADTVYIDFETTSADVRTCEPTGVAVGANGQHRYLPVKTLPMDPHLDWEGAVKPFLAEIVAMGKKIIVHNAKFDLVLWRRWGLPMPEDWEDTMVMAWMSDPHRRKGLKVLAAGILDMDATSYAKTVKGKKDLSDVPLVDSAHYASEDTRMTEELYPILQRELGEKKLMDKYLLNKQQVELVRWVEEGGLPINRDRLLALQREAKQYQALMVQEATERVRKLACERRDMMLRGQLKGLDGRSVRWPRDLHPEALTCVAGEKDTTDRHDREAAEIDWAELLARPVEEIREFAGKKRSADDHELNLRSSTQMSQFLFGTLALPTDQYENIKEGINKSMLIRLRRDGYELADTLIKFSRVNKLGVGFFEPLMSRLEEREGWWWVHGEFNPYGTSTGRWSSNSPNLQNLPNADKKLSWSAVRSAFEAPPGWTLVVADLSQIELRLIAHYSKDPVLRQIYNEGGDIHALTGAKLAGVEYSEFAQWAPAEDKHADQYTDQENQYVTWRKRAKPVNFGVSYRMGAPKFRMYAADSYDVWITVKEAEAYIKAFFDLYSGITRYHNAVLEQIIARGFVPTIGGRKGFFDPELARICKAGNKRDPNYFRGDADWRKAVNFPIQGSAADLMVRAMLTIMAQYQGCGYAKIISQVHDEVLLLVRDEHAAEVARFVKEVMESTAVLDQVPLLSSVKVAKNWLQAH